MLPIRPFCSGGRSTCHGTSLGILIFRRRGTRLGLLPFDSSDLSGSSFLPKGLHRGKFIPGEIPACLRIASRQGYNLLRGKNPFQEASLSIKTLRGKSSFRESLPFGFSPESEINFRRCCDDEIRFASFGIERLLFLSLSRRFRSVHRGDRIHPS